MKIGAGLEETVQSLQMKLIRKDLKLWKYNTITNSLSLGITSSDVHNLKIYMYISAHLVYTTDNQLILSFKDTSKETFIRETMPPNYGANRSQEASTVTHNHHLGILSTAPIITG